MGVVSSYIKNPDVEISNNKDDISVYKKYGWVPDLPDRRDLLRIPENMDGFKPVIVDLRYDCPDIYNQGKLGSCTANAIAAAYEYDQIKQKEYNTFIPSRLFIYYNERAKEGTIKYDSGAQIRTGIKSINSIGVCPEENWEYDINRYREKPTDKCYDIAKNHKSVKYRRVKQDFDHLQECLRSGLPFVFGFGVYESFESEKVASTGIMTMPTKNEKLLGGHAVMAVGYDDNRGVFIVRNSWGKNWGDNGYFYMPYEFIILNKYCDDFWTIQKVKDNN